MKPSAESLAILGGAPAFREHLHVGRPNVGDRDVFNTRVREILDRRWFTNNGPVVRSFEQKVAEFLGARHCIAMCSGTIALEIAIRALELKGEVIIPSFTFVATAHAFQWQEITPVFCDIDPKTHTIDPDQIERHITPRTSGILGVHVWGTPCDTNRIGEIAERHKLLHLYDASHAFGATHGGVKIGNFGNAEVFSFHATKFMNTFEGGAVVTNDDLLAKKMRLMKNFGFSGYDEVIYIGTNGKMNEISAAMGLTNLESIDRFIEANRNNYMAYEQGLSGVRGMTLYPAGNKDRRNFQYVVAEVDEEAGLTRDQLIRVLHAENVLARRYFFPGCHRMEPYRSYFPHASLLLPNTERLCNRVLVLPTGTAIDVEQVRTICTILRTAIDHSDTVRHALSN